MSKRGYISRYLLILKKLRAKPYSSYQELHGYLEDQFSYLQMQDDTLNIGFSKRTFQRDIREIRNTFGIDIEYSSRNKGYYIAQSETENMNFQRMIEAFDLFNSLNLSEDLRSFIHLETRKPTGTENLHGLIHAIKNRYQIRFSYQKFWDEESSQRTADPHALKEFRNRWYVLAKDKKDGQIKSFALDRLNDLEITNHKFEPVPGYDVNEHYRHSFGIISPNGQKAQEIILSFEPFQGKYIKTLPLHETQRILVDNPDEVRIGLTLCVTLDLVMELLSFGGNVKVLKPKSLVEEIKSAHLKALNKYQTIN